jgi:excisionase family DNA binding protein
MNETIQKQLEELKELMLSNKRILTVNDIVNYTSYSKSHIYKLTSKNKIPFSKPGGKAIFFDKKEIDRWLLKNKVSPIDEDLKYQ